MAGRTFVILAAGRGSRIGRVGESLHKALVPLENRAAISHIIGNVPDYSKLVICLGHRGDQIKEYVRLAHARRDVAFVNVEGWDQIGGGPGRSLLAAAPHIEGDLMFTSCDTLWKDRPFEWDHSWVATAPIPTGTAPDRWCRVYTSSQRQDDGSGLVLGILDKEPGGPDEGFAYTGLAHIAHGDLPAFWGGLRGDSLRNAELQVSGGLKAIMRHKRLYATRIHWTDIGDEASYR